jgi:hypothetical protein
MQHTELPVYSTIFANGTTMYQFPLATNCTVMYGFTVTLDTVDTHALISAEFEVCGNIHDKIAFKYVDVNVSDGKTIADLNFYFNSEATPLIASSVPFGQRYLNICTKKPYNIVLGFIGKDTPVAFPTIIKSKRQYVYNLQPSQQCHINDLVSLNISVNNLLLNVDTPCVIVYYKKYKHLYNADSSVNYSSTDSSTDSSSLVTTLSLSLSSLSI